MKQFLLAPAACLLLLLFSCQNNNGENKDVADLSRSLSDSTSITSLTGDSVKLVKTAAANIKVKDVEQSTRAVSALVQKLGGMLTLQNMEAVEQGRRELALSGDSILVITAVSRHADITARVPSQQLEAFLFGVADLGYFTGSSHLQVDDKSLSYLENSLKQKIRTNVLSEAPAKNRTADTRLQTVALADQAVEQNISNRTIDADVNYSTVSLNLFQNATVQKEVMANPYLDSYDLSFWKRLSNAVQDGWNFFLSFLIALAHLWMFLLLGVLLLIWYRSWQQKKRLV